MGYGDDLLHDLASKLEVSSVLAAPEFWPEKQAEGVSRGITSVR